MKFLRSTILLLVVQSFICSAVIAQAGIYSEAEIEYQAIFFDAELAKIKGDSEAQINFLKEILKRNKSEHAAYFELAKAYFLKEEYEQAQKNIEHATSINPENEWYLLTAAEIYEKSNQYGKAAHQYKKLLKITPKNQASYHKLSLNLLNNGQINEAALALENCQSVNGIDEESSRRLFDLYSKSNKKEKALSILKNLSHEFPDNVRYLNNLAGYLNEIGQHGEAQKIFHKVLELEPDNVQASLALVKEKTPKSEAGEYLTSLIPVMENNNIPLDNKIRELMPFISSMTKESNSTSALLRISENLVDQYPKEAKVYAVRGDVLFYSGNFAEAEKAYETSISYNDKQFILWDQWMLNLWELEEYVKLESVSFKAIDLFPNEVNGYIMNALSLVKLNKVDEAKTFAEEANFIAANSQRYKHRLKIFNTWLKKEYISADLLKSTVDKIDTSEIYNQIYFELLGDIYKQIPNDPMSKRMWEIAIKQGSDPKRINQKSGA